MIILIIYFYIYISVRKVDEINAEEEIREAFKVFDSVGFHESQLGSFNLKTAIPLQNGDGFINRQELGYVMDNLGEKMEKEEIESLINEIDIDGKCSEIYQALFNQPNT